MPSELNVCYFVNSGSEANELALRLARTATNGTDIITPDHGYHGNTNAAVEVSAYKFNKPNGIGRRPWVHLVELADDFRGQFRRSDPNRANKYANLLGYNYQSSDWYKASYKVFNKEYDFSEKKFSKIKQKDKETLFKRFVGKFRKLFN